MNQTIKIYKESVDAVIPTKNNNTDAGYDLTSVDTVTVKAGERKLIPIGLRIIIPQGYYFTFAPRSGMAFKHNLIPSHHNVMDYGYTGDMSVLMHNRSDVDYTINKGDRFCQLILHQVPMLDALEISVEEFNSLTFDRGDKGFGSSGK